MNTAIADGRVIVLTKAPRPGLAKTRLAAELDPPAAAAIAAVLLDHTTARLASFPRVELRVTPDDALAELHRWRRPEWNLVAQGPGDLGTRLTRAFGEAFAAGEGRVVVIGSDCPALAESDLLEAFQALDSADVVLGPARDGGYWLVGLRAPHPALFEGIPWGSETVLDETSRRAEAAGLSRRMLRTLMDVDTLADWRAWLRMEPT